MTTTETDVTRADLAEALAHLNEYAKHQQHHPGNRKYVEAHAKIDRMLTAWERARA